MIADSFEPEHARSIARVLVRRDSTDLGHEECRGGERVLGVGDEIGGNSEPAINGVERLVSQTAGESVGGIEDADIEFGVGNTAQIGL